MWWGICNKIWGFAVSPHLKKVTWNFTFIIQLSLYPKKVF